MYITTRVLTKCKFLKGRGLHFASRALLLQKFLCIVTSSICVKRQFHILLLCLQHNIQNVPASALLLCSFALNGNSNFCLCALPKTEIFSLCIVTSSICVKRQFQFLFMRFAQNRNFQPLQTCKKKPPNRRLLDLGRR